jgi:hypothetical protein
VVALGSFPFFRLGSWTLKTTVQFPRFNVLNFEPDFMQTFFERLDTTKFTVAFFEVILTPIRFARLLPS